jgi:hypothetical protein
MTASPDLLLMQYNKYEESKDSYEKKYDDKVRHYSSSTLSVQTSSEGVNTQACLLHTLSGAACAVACLALIARPSRRAGE